MPEYGRFFLRPNPAVVPKPTHEANRCNLRHVTPKTLQKALYVVFSESGRPLQVVWFGWSRFPMPEALVSTCRRPCLSPRPVLAPCSGFSFQLSAFVELGQDRHPDFSFQPFSLSAFPCLRTQATTPNAPTPPKRQPLLG